MVGTTSWKSIVPFSMLFCINEFIFAKIWTPMATCSNIHANETSQCDQTDLQSTHAAFHVALVGCLRYNC